MSVAFAVVADDLTGAADTGAGLLAKGFRPLVSWCDSSADLARLDDVDAVAIDAQTRVMDARAARAATFRIVAAVRAVDVPILYKKCDSLLRGHIGVEVAAACDAWYPGAIAVVAPAFPELGRTTVGGRQYVDGVPVSSLSIDEMLQHAAVPATRADLDTVRGDALDRFLAQQQSAGIRAVVCDAEDDRDLAAITSAGERLRPRVVWVGTGGLVRLLAVRPPVSRRPPPSTLVAGFSRGPVLAVIGSRSAVARMQAGELMSIGMSHVSVVIDATCDDADRRCAAGAQQAASELTKGHDVLITLDGPTESPERRRVAERLAAALQPCAALVTALVVTGGDTATAVLRAWGTTALRLIDEIEPGVPLSLSLAPKSIPVVTKAGAFGRPHALVHAVEHLRQMKGAGAS